MFSPYVLAALAILISLFILRRREADRTQDKQQAPKPHPRANQPPKDLPGYIQTLLAEIPSCIILQSDVVAFQEALEHSWAQQNREIIPACIVRPHDAQQLSKAVMILKQEHDNRNRVGASTKGFFAIRSGGANSGLGAATVQDGTVVDLSLFCQVMPASDGSTVTIGTGARWIDVYKTLDEKGLTVIGGRNSPVGVGGLALQGGISFYSSRFGFVCSNIVSYEIVLADGSLVTASASENPKLWRVLKGGSNNFGIVTRFTIRSLPSAPLWGGGMITLAAFQYAKSLKAYHNYLEQASSGRPATFDENACGPILSFVYIRAIGLQLLALSLMYTEAPKDNKWPIHWRETGFNLLRGLRLSRVESHTSAVERYGRTASAGSRHVMGTTTICNDLKTMEAAYAIFCQATCQLSHVKGLLFPFTFQAILPGWMNKGYPNVLSLEGCTEPLVIIGFSVFWADAENDELVRSTIRRTIDLIDEAAIARKSDHPYRFMNYCMEWQRPYDGCSEENQKLMRDASQEYDSTGLFQSGRIGGFTLDFLG